jgi:superoxide dismutase, Fe-Mn family
VTDDVSRQTYPFSLPDLPYPYEALEPHLDEKTLRIHHREHHAAYVKKLNEALANDPPLQRLTLAQLLHDVTKLPDAVRTAVRNNGGGHLNHDLYWRSLAPAPARPPVGTLGEQIAKDFGSFAAFQEKFGDAAGKHFASGWVALAYAAKKLSIVDLKDHEILRESEATAILILDVWEHAYYVKYQHRRPEFIKAFWNVVDWASAQERFSHSGAGTGV